MALDKQFQALYIDTGSLYSNHELYLHRKMHKIRQERKILKEELDCLQNQILDIDNQFDFKEMVSNTISSVCLDWLSDNQEDMTAHELYRLVSLYNDKTEYYKHKNNKIKEIKDNLSSLLAHKVKQNEITNGKDHIRQLRDDSVYSDIENKIIKKNIIISIFDSALSRTLEFKEDELTLDYMVMQIYFFDIFKDVIKYGFMFNGEKYIYYSSSAGQIRTKRAVFLKESLYKKHMNTIMCGLSIDKINQKGGINANKLLAYLALSNSATDVWKEFDIDKSIVIPDFETKVNGVFDFIDDLDFSITKTEGQISITHTDGAGMVLPNAFGEKQKNKMIRLPWIKGLLGVFDFQRFLIEIDGANPVIQDIYGVEHDIIAEDIQVIFTESQFKMHKYYESWDEYKNCYKQYYCTAGFANEEEDKIKNALINYQMLQSLTDITDDEIALITRTSVNSITGLCSSLEHVKSAFEVTPYNTNKTAFQKCIELYPSLLNDKYTKYHLKEIKDSLRKKYRSGKLQINGKYTFLLPDFFAACEYWFTDNKNPEGLLKDGQVFCWLFNKYKKLDCLRSPHLYMEHAVRYNIASDEVGRYLKEWFTTSAIYTSCHDMISRILQFDVDGDKSLVVADETLIQVAERNIEKFDIIPLYYEMKKALPHIINNDVIYQSLITAFTGGNIGIYSNNISKIWNSSVFLNGTYQEQINALNCIKRLTAQNNYVIDYAKTLYKPEFPKDIQDEVKSFTKEKLPAFFEFAKDKTENQITGRNDSFVNKLFQLIPNTKISFKKLHLDKFNYRLLMRNPDIQFDIEFNENGSLNEKKTDKLILKYCEISKNQNFQLNSIMNDKMDSNEVKSKSQIRQDLKYRLASNDIKKQLSVFGYSDVEVADILIKYLYGIKDNKRKTILWLCYGDIIYENLSNKLKNNLKEVQCEVCGKWFTVTMKNNKTCMCNDCYDVYRKEYRRNFMRDKRQNYTN